MKRLDDRDGSEYGKRKCMVLEAGVLQV